MSANVARAGGRSTPPNDWRIRLPCGHLVAIPWESAVPAQMACIVHHQVECVEPLPPVASSWRALPIDPAGVVEAP